MEDNCSFTLNLASRNKPDFSLPKVVKLELIDSYGKIM